MDKWKIKYSKNKVYKLFVVINELLYHRKDMVKNIGKINGENPDKIFYIIRSENVATGLFTLANYAMDGVLTAQIKE